MGGWVRVVMGNIGAEAPARTDFTPPAGAGPWPRRRPGGVGPLEVGGRGLDVLQVPRASGSLGRRSPARPRAGPCSGHPADLAARAEAGLLRASDGAEARGVAGDSKPLSPGEQSSVSPEMAAWDGLLLVRAPRREAGRACRSSGHRAGGREPPWRPTPADLAEGARGCRSGPRSDGYAAGAVALVGEDSAAAPPCPAALMRGRWLRWSCCPARATIA
jgi:hypothetical protein